MSNEPLVSVVIPTRNRSQWLQRNLLGVAAQDLPEFEVIVVDDGSSQEHRDTYAALQEKLDERFTFLLPVCADVPGTGPSAARNRGIKAARGTYVAFCDDDDYWDATDHLSLAVQTLDKHKADFFFTNMRAQQDDEVKIADWFPNSPLLRQGPRVHDTHAIYEVSLESLMKTMGSHYPSLNTCVFRRSILEKAGLLWERVRFAEDVNLLLRVTDICKGIFFRDEVVPICNVSPRESAFLSVDEMEQALTSIHGAQHAYTLIRHPACKRCAKAFETWQYRRLANLLRQQGFKSQARAFSWRAWSTLPSLGNARELLRNLLH